MDSAPTATESAADLAAFRERKDAFLRGSESPLDPADRASHVGLHYFPSTPALSFTLDLDRNVLHDLVTMETSDGQQRQYRRVGRVRFAVDGTAAQLTVYEDEHGFFLPFRDATSEHESYSAGRYLEPELLPDGKLRVDFNYAYNPFCAYSESYSCPLPPVENRLAVPIRAGEQRFHD